jgi:chaperonin GroEL (HSP60 family)
MQALSSNIEACLQLASVVQTTLGPCGMDKLLVDETDGVKTTNDGATLVKYLHLEHPAALLLAQVSKSQVRSIMLIITIIG